MPYKFNPFTGNLDTVNPAIAPNQGWEISNEVTTKVLDANATSVNELADVLGTLIQTLIAQGILEAPAASHPSGSATGILGAATYP